MKTCKYCGSELIDTAKKCSHCGEWLDEEMRPTTTSHPINEINTVDSESQATKKGISFKEVAFAFLYSNVSPTIK